MAEGETLDRDIDAVIRQVRQRMPEARVARLRVKWPADDDNLWWFSLPGVKQDIQIEGAACPFLLETEEQCCGLALKAATVAEATGMIVDYLESARAGRPRRLSGQLYW